MAGIQDIPLNIPSQWDPVWFRRFVQDVLSKLDPRNANATGLTITADGNEVANFATLVTQQSVTDDIEAGIDDHVAESDPHAQYLTEAAAATSYVAYDLVRAGTGSPEGVVVGNIGNVWQRTDGSGSTALYIKGSGTGNTGWVALTLP